jgi:hypothetical protein
LENLAIVIILALVIGIFLHLIEDLLIWINSKIAKGRIKKRINAKNGFKYDGRSNTPEFAIWAQKKRLRRLQQTPVKTKKLYYFVNPRPLKLL